MEDLINIYLYTRRRQAQAQAAHTRSTLAKALAFFALQRLQLNTCTKSELTRADIQEPPECTWRCGYERAKANASNDFTLKFLNIDLVSFEMLLADFEPVILV